MHDAPNGRMLARHAFALATVLATSSCIGADKGAEDPIPGDGKDDSFFQPTQHGSLAFGLDNRASFIATEQFHAWTFKLTAAASVKLETSLQTPNLDTVLYLYKRTSPTDSWGSYIKRNDDANDETAASLLDVELEAAEYRVLVKAYKQTQRGDFAVRGECSGAGCPVSSCPAAEALPADTGYGGACGARVGAAIGFADVEATQSFEIPLDDRCTLPELERRAVDLYADYFAQFDGLEPDTELEVSTSALGGSGAGTLVDVTDGGDESAMSFLFDRDGQLLLFYQHNQSPDVQFFCRESGAATVTLPSQEDCIGALVGALPHEDGTESDVDLTASTNNLPLGLGAEVRGPMLRYAQTVGASASTSLHAQGAAWGDYTKVTHLDIQASGKPSIGYLATDDLIVIETPAGGDAALVCK